MPLVAILSVADGFSQQLSPNREAAIKAEVGSFFDQYTRWFEADRADLIAEKV
jgi:hypothetical protein